MAGKKRNSRRALLVRANAVVQAMKVVIEVVILPFVQAMSVGAEMLVVP
jgi:hypothetical protein